nr:uncharacterized protein LOC127347411 [Lolium perenne]
MERGRWDPWPRHHLQAVAREKRTQFQFREFTPKLISGDLSHQLTHRFFLLKSILSSLFPSKRNIPRAPGCLNFSSQIHCTGEFPGQIRDQAIFICEHIRGEVFRRVSGERLRVNQGVEHTIDPPSLSSARRLPHGRRGPNASSSTIQGATSPPIVIVLIATSVSAKSVPTPPLTKVSLAAEEDVRITSLCPTCLPVASVKEEDSMLFAFRLMLNSDLCLC